MAKKKKHDSIVVVHEGYREGYFVDYISQFSPVHVNYSPCYGISASHVLETAFKKSDNGLRVIAFFDEDFERIVQRKITDENLAILAERWGQPLNVLSGTRYRELQTCNIKNANPILAISYPGAIEGLLLSIVGVPEAQLRGNSTATLKEKFNRLLENVTLTAEDKCLIDGYDKRISMMTELQQREPENKEQTRYLNSQKQILGNKKSAVIFKRFLALNISLEVLQSKRATIKTIDILLNALGL